MVAFRLRVLPSQTSYLSLAVLLLRGDVRSSRDDLDGDAGNHGTSRGTHPALEDAPRGGGGRKESVRTTRVASALGRVSRFYFWVRFVLGTTGLTKFCRIGKDMNRSYRVSLSVHVLVAGALFGFIGHTIMAVSWY